MSILSSKSGLIQTVKPSTRIESGQTTALGVSSVIENLQQAKPDTNASSGAGLPYGGDAVFGLFTVDESLDGEIT